MPNQHHTDREYEEQLERLRALLLAMAGQVEQMIGRAMQAFIDRDVDLARQTISSDAKVNSAELEADQMCLLILAKRQPMASDLRFVTLALKMVTDLERIGDLAVNICERAIDLAQHPPVPVPVGMVSLGQHVQAMVRDAIDAFVKRDADLARSVIERDDEVDDSYTRIFRAALEDMLADKGSVQDGIHIQSIAKWLERIGDHSTNIAEQVIFMVEGQDIRHEGKLT